MSSDALPISPSRFAAALPDLPLSALHLKVLELRNSITHLDYSNEQLRPPNQRPHNNYRKKRNKKANLTKTASTP
ncbi:hypothetical protein N0V88_004578 [Collariella sp. IMI 366227]|nr:hypothetical protein N0V88_004578 [Collariella sp. IMI 366227]